MQTGSDFSVRLLCVGIGLFVFSHKHLVHKELHVKGGLYAISEEEKASGP
jgi:hypothetical protein